MKLFLTKILGSLAFALILASASYLTLGGLGAALIGLIEFFLMLILTSFSHLSGINLNHFPSSKNVKKWRSRNAISELQYE